MPGLVVPYATLDAFRTRFAVAVGDTSDDARMFGKLKSATQGIDRYCARTFNPVVDTRLFDYRNARTVLFRGEDLMALTTLTNGDGNVVDPTAIIQLGGTNGPLWGLEINVAKGSYLNYLTTKTRAISVAGIWGWHDDYARTAWRPSSDTLNGGITSSATTITVNNTAGSDGWGLTPRFQTGQLLQIESEFLMTTAVPNATTLTVIRGVNGSTAVSHLTAVPIQIYSPPPDIVEMTLRWAAWITRIEDAGEFGATDGMTADGASGGVHVPLIIPPDVLAQLDPFRKVSMSI